MLTKITLHNFKSFKNTETIDLTKTNYTILPQNVADNGVLKGCIFVGANASGKSTIILGVKLLLDFLFLERNMNSGIFVCMFGDNPCYSLKYDFLIDKKNIHYSTTQPTAYPQRNVCVIKIQLNPNYIRWNHRYRSRYHRSGK